MNGRTSYREALLCASTPDSVSARSSRSGARPGPPEWTRWETAPTSALSSPPPILQMEWGAPTPSPAPRWMPVFVPLLRPYSLGVKTWKTEYTGQQAHEHSNESGGVLGRKRKGLGGEGGHGAVTAEPTPAQLRARGRGAGILEQSPCPCAPGLGRSDEYPA